MRPNRIYITRIVLLIFLSGKARRLEKLPTEALTVGCGEPLQPCGGIFPIVTDMARFLKEFDQIKNLKPM